MPIPKTNISDGEYRAACEFLIYEARLFDQHRYLEWLELISDDIHYELVAPTVQSAADATTAPKTVPLFSENRASLQTRIEQLANPAFTVSESPPSRSRHFVTNIWVERGGQADQLAVFSNLLVYRGRGFDLPPHFFPIVRNDILNQVDGGLQLESRRAESDEHIIGSRSITLLI
ncbi:MAG: hypothetical protein JKY89_02500 [Immundisolibacteraceae bacterium]|nr:hypothetical protein [Immundisolibacteraceae bacterium]